MGKRGTRRVNATYRGFRKPQWPSNWMKQKTSNATTAGKKDTSRTNVTGRGWNVNACERPMAGDEVMKEVRCVSKCDVVRTFFDKSCHVFAQMGCVEKPCDFLGVLYLSCVIVSALSLRSPLVILQEKKFLSMF